MTMAQKIENHIRTATEIEGFKAINDSHKHAGHAGDNGTGESHFRIEVISASLATLPRVQAHRIIMTAIKPLFDQGLHALSIKINSP